MDILPHEKQIYEYIKTIQHLKNQSQDHPAFREEVQKLEKSLDKIKEEVYSHLTPWQRVMICRHPFRPHSIDYIKNICEEFHELGGDRKFRDDPAIIGGIARIDDLKCVVIGQEKGNNTESRLYRNFGMPHPEGYRKAFKLMKLAEKFGLPVLSLIDTPGAYPGLEAEERGQGWAIAENLREMSILNTPIIVIVIGEGCSGGALGIGVGDVIGMLEHAYYSVISPEGCASILWKNSAKNIEAAEALKLNAQDLLPFNIIDYMLPEPQGGAHHDVHAVFQTVKKFVLDQWAILRRIPSPLLLEQRYLKFRRMGQFQEENISKV